MYNLHDFVLFLYTNGSERVEKPTMRSIEIKIASFPSLNGIIARGEKMTTGKARNKQHQTPRVPDTSPQ